MAWQAPTYGVGHAACRKVLPALTAMLSCLGSCPKRYWRREGSAGFDRNEFWTVKSGTLKLWSLESLDGRGKARKAGVHDLGFSQGRAR